MTRVLFPSSKFSKFVNLSVVFVVVKMVTVFMLLPHAWVLGYGTESHVTLSVYIVRIRSYVRIEKLYVPTWLIQTV